ncbi:MAG: D-tyrosyl-tRNA(Tyr) deacylase [Burkholderiales bacterium]|nr:D-tyrosyl-tRNA(Tyr) deacylase [Burkholderiales bacterium]
MIVLIQRVLRSSCTVDGEVTGECGNGLLLFVCAEKTDTPKTVSAMANKVLKYRVFHDDMGKMNLSALDIGAEILVVPQFTLAADTNSGTRPSLSLGASPEVGKKFFEQFVEEIKSSGLKTGQGVFGAHMEISLVNDGPVTFWLQVPKKS